MMKSYDWTALQSLSIVGFIIKKICLKREIELTVILRRHSEHKKDIHRMTITTGIAQNFGFLL